MEFRDAATGGVAAGGGKTAAADEVRKTEGADSAGKTSADEPILKGAGIESIVKSSMKLLQSAPEVLSDIMQQVYETKKATIDNLKPSDKELELRRRRLEELKELQRKLQDEAIDFEQARVQFLSMFDPDDIAAIVDPYAQPVRV